MSIECQGCGLLFPSCEMGLAEFYRMDESGKQESYPYAICYDCRKVADEGGHRAEAMFEQIERRLLGLM